MQRRPESDCGQEIILKQSGTNSLQRKSGARGCCTHTTCLQLDGKCISTIRWISQPQRSRPLETGSKLLRSLKTAAMIAMGVKRMMRGVQRRASRVRRRPRRQGRTSTGIVLSEQLDLSSLRRDNRGSKLFVRSKKGWLKLHLCCVFQQFSRCVAGANGCLFTATVEEQLFDKFLSVFRGLMFLHSAVSSSHPDVSVADPDSFSVDTRSSTFVVWLKTT